MVEDFKSIKTFQSSRTITKSFLNQNKGQKEMINAYLESLLNPSDPLIPFKDIYLSTKTTILAQKSAFDNGKGMKLNTDEVLKHLLNYIENENYKGWDPYDLLNSSFLKNSPLYSLSFFRLLFIQLGKRSPFNLRRLLNVPKEHNSKGLALILMGYINLYKIAINGNTKFGNPETLKKIEYLSELLVKKSCAGYSGACWGYNFPWQARNLFYFPKQTPTVVATSFCSKLYSNHMK